MSKGKILMLEQDGDDRFITEKFFREHSIDVELEFVTTYDELRTKLREGKTSLILLSMRAAPVTAPEIISNLKGSAMRKIPVVVLSGVRDEKMIRDCYERGAVSVIIKPDSVQETEKKILSFVNYWFDIVELTPIHS